MHHCRAADQHGLSAASVSWLDKAITAYHRGRVYKVLNKVDSHSSDDVLQALGKTHI